MTTLVVGGTRGLGLAVARHRRDEGDDVVITGRDPDRLAQVVAELGDRVRGVRLDLAEPTSIGPALADVGPVDKLVLGAIDRDENSVREYDLARASRLATIKLVGYIEVVHTLVADMPDDAAVVVFGGRAKDRPYVGSTTVSTVNGGVVGMVAAMAVELAPIRVNALHPGIVGDSPYWASKPAGVLDGVRARTPGGQLVSMADIVSAVDFLLTNRGVNGQQLCVDRGTMLA